MDTSPTVSPPTSQALDLGLANHDRNQITFTLHYPSATRGGATCYLIKGATSLPPTKSTESWQIPLADLSSNRAVRAIHPLTDTLKPGAQVRVGFSRRWMEMWKPRGCVRQERWCHRMTPYLDGWLATKNKNKQTNKKIGLNLCIYEWNYSAWKHKTSI